MKIKGRGILVLCLLVFGGFAVYDYFQDKTKETKKMEDSRLMTVNFDQVNEVQIEKGLDKILLKRTVDGWQMEAPLKDNADNGAVEDLIKSSFTERVIEVAKEGADIDWKLYGLDAPLGTITFKATDGKQNVFQVSAKNNFEDNAFARRDGENRVIVINSIWQNRLAKKSIEYRDRRFLRHKIASVDDLKLKNTKGLLHLQRKEGQWTVANRKDIKLDQNSVRSLLTALAEAKGSEIIEGTQKAPTLRNLFSLDLIMDKKKWNAQVGQADRKGIYARVSEPSQTMKLEPGALDNLINLSAEDLKEKPPEKNQLDKINEEKEKE